MKLAGGPMPTGGVSTSQSPPYSVPVRYMALGVVCFGLFAVDFALQSVSLAQGNPGSPGIVALTHLLTLGALLSFVMGAVYQLTTVAFLIPLSSVPAARWNFWLYLVSLAGLFYSMSSWWSAGLLAFGFAMVLAVYIYAFVLIASLLRTKIRGPMFHFVVSAHIYLILAVSVAVLLVLADSGSVPSLLAWLGPLLATHIVLAMGGFFTFLVMGFSFKLLSMFTLSHGFSTWRQKWTLILAHLALWFALLGVWTKFSVGLWTGVVFGILAFASHLADFQGIVKKRMRKKVEPPIRAVLAAAVGGILGLGLFAVRLLFVQGEAGWQEVVMFYLMGVVTLMVIAFAYKIVPFLIWTKRYSKSANLGKSVLISDLIDLNYSRPVLVSFGAGLVAVTASGSIQWNPGVVAGCILISLATIAFCIQILKVMEPAKLGKELLKRD